MKKVGLTLGKYAPFHKGHQLVIETALVEVDELIVLIYDTDVIDIPVSRRAEWIRELYPMVTVIECYDGPVGYSYERTYQKLEEEYIYSKLEGRKISAFYSSEFYGEHVSQFLAATDRRIDSGREIVPTSGTDIRNNPYTNREYLSPIVYWDFVTKAVFLGAMSTGKSTLTEALAKKFNTSFAPEYGREYWTKHQVDRRINLEAFDDLAMGHIQKEYDCVREANEYFFVDTNAITTYVYSLDYHGKAPDLLSKLAKENTQRYDIFFLCDDDIPYDDTWDRSGDQKRHIFHKQIIDDLEERNIPYIKIRGTLEERITQVEDELLKYEARRNNS